MKPWIGGPRWVNVYADNGGQFVSLPHPSVVSADAGAARIHAAGEIRGSRVRRVLRLKITPKPAGKWERAL